MYEGAVKSEAPEPCPARIRSHDLYWCHQGQIKRRRGMPGRGNMLAVLPAADGPVIGNTAGRAVGAKGEIQQDPELLQFDKRAVFNIGTPAAAFALKLAL